MAATRCTVFIDGSNFYHGLRRLGVDSQDLDYQRMVKKLLVDRELQGIRYYVGRLSGDLPRMRRQSRALNTLRRQGIRVELGRVERNTMPAHANPLVRRLREVVVARRTVLPPSLAAELESLCDQEVAYYVEKQVDVLIAVDMVGMAQREEYDLAYLLSADGDCGRCVHPSIERLARRVGRPVSVNGNSPIASGCLRWDAHPRCPLYISLIPLHFAHSASGLSHQEDAITYRKAA